MAILGLKIVYFRPLYHLRGRKLLNNISKWMILDSIVQLFTADQMKIFSKRSMANLNSNIFLPKMAIFDIWEVEGIKWYIKMDDSRLYSTTFHCRSDENILKRSLVVFKSKMAIIKPKMAILGLQIQNGHY